LATILLYLVDEEYSSKVIQEIIDNTPVQYLDELLLCSDHEVNDLPEYCVSFDFTGAAAFFNKAIESAKSDDIIILKGCVKVKSGWINGLVNLNDKVIATPITYLLDKLHWSTQNQCMRKYAYRWDMSIYDKKDPSTEYSPSASPFCIAFSKSTFKQVGNFDELLQSDEDGEILDFSIAAWMSDCKIVVVKESKIAAPELPIPAKHNNAARIVEKWFAKYASRFYDRKGINANQYHVGSLEECSDLAGDQYLEKYMPELVNIYDLRNVGTGRTIAVVGPGPSIELFNPAIVYRHDLLIGVDYVGLLYKCDYVATFDVNVVLALRENYADNQFILPTALYNRRSLSFVSACEVAPKANICEMAEQGDLISSVHPPFINFDSSVLFATHVGLFLNASSVSVFGFDNKIINGKSHSVILDYYDDGAVWANNESTQNEFLKYEKGLRILGELATSSNIPLMRICHA
jgi:hypothetical protein